MITKFHVPTSNDMGLLNGSKTSWLTCDLTCLSEDQPCYLRNIPHRMSEKTFLEFELNDRATRKWRVNAKCFTIVFGKEPPLLRVLRRILTALIISSPCILGIASSGFPIPDFSGPEEILPESGNFKSRSGNREMHFLCNVINKILQFSRISYKRVAFIVA